MNFNWAAIAVACLYALAGGWLAARVSAILSGRSLSPPAMMAACLAAAGWCFIVVFGSLAIGLSLCLAWALIVLATVDVLTFRLPDVVTLPLIAIGLAGTALLPASRVLDHLAAAALAYVVLWGISVAYRRVRGGEGLGLGDAKLAAAAGAWLGLEALPSVLFLASIAGIAWVLASAGIRGRGALADRIPFGAPLCAVIWYVWLYGPIVPLAAS